MNQRALLLAAAVAALAAVFPAPGRAAPEIETLDAWAYPQRTAIVFSEPSEDADRVSKLRFLTELRSPEIYRVSGRIESEEDGLTWLRIDVLGRPNGRVGWVPADALNALHPIRARLVIRRSALRAILYKGKRKVWSAPIGIGRKRWPTPAGDFYIREGIRLKGGDGVYGSYAFGTSAYSPSLSDWPGGGVIGIHGTNQPDLIPGAISHGCVRIRNDKINQLRRLAGVGTAIEIR